MSIRHDDNAVVCSCNECTAEFLARCEVGAAENRANPILAARRNPTDERTATCLTPGCGICRRAGERLLQGAALNFHSASLRFYAPSKKREKHARLRDDFERRWAAENADIELSRAAEAFGEAVAATHKPRRGK